MNRRTHAIIITQQQHNTGTPNISRSIAENEQTRKQIRMRRWTGGGGFLWEPGLALQVSLWTKNSYTHNNNVPNNVTL